MSDANSSATDLDVRTISRTLTAAGYEITDARRQPRALVVECQRVDVFGVAVPYLIVVSDADRPPEDDEANLRRDAERDRRVLVLVARQAGAQWLSWAEFLEAMGGAVPNWRALAPSYRDVLRSAARNRQPPAYAGEPWRIHEEAVADGLEFIFGRRVRRLGGARRGRRVGDVVALTPDEHILVIDAKAADAPYDVGWPELRPLREYVEQQRARQRGQVAVSGAVISAADYQQDQTRLVELSTEFAASTRVALSFVETEALVTAVTMLSERPDLRNSILWSRVFCRPGRVTPEILEREVRAAAEERLAREPPLRSPPTDS